MTLSLDAKLAAMYERGRIKGHRDAEKRLDILNTVLGTFAGLLEAEWYNGNLDTRAYERLNADLTGIRAKYIGAIGATTPVSDDTEGAG